MNRRHPECLELLAGEYVMGTLRGTARRRFERMLRQDDELGRRVSDWEARLGRLTDSVAPVEPPPWVWARIERSLDLGRAREAIAPRASLWNSAPFWRSLAMAATLLLAVFTAIVSRPGGQSEDWAKAVVAHVIEDRQALEARQSVPPGQVAGALAHVNVRLTGDLGETTFLGYCLVEGRLGIHLVVNTPYGRATVIVLPGGAVRAPDRHSADGFTGIVLPGKGGVTGVVTDSPAALPEVEAYVKDRLGWL
jgi:hypothetical protein